VAMRAPQASHVTTRAGSRSGRAKSHAQGWWGCAAQGGGGVGRLRIAARGAASRVHAGAFKGTAAPFARQGGEAQHGAARGAAPTKWAACARHGRRGQRVVGDGVRAQPMARAGVVRVTAGGVTVRLLTACCTAVACRCAVRIEHAAAALARAQRGGARPRGAAGCPAEDATGRASGGHDAWAPSVFGVTLARH
jgi:hypothetical protein